MNIKIVCVGKLKEKYLKQGIAEYSKRLSKFCKFEIIEVPDEKAPEKLSPAEMEAVKQKEGERILHKIKDKEPLHSEIMGDVLYLPLQSINVILKIGRAHV